MGLQPEKGTQTVLDSINIDKIDLSIDHEFLSYTMSNPTIGSVWKHKVQSNVFITIVDSSIASCKRKNIAYQYHDTGHIGGCNSSEWFYDDWISCDAKIIQQP